MNETIKDKKKSDSKESIVEEQEALASYHKWLQDTYPMRLKKMKEEKNKKR